MMESALDLAEYYVDRNYCVTVIPAAYDDGSPECGVVALEPHLAILPALVSENINLRTRALITVAIASHRKLSEHNLTFRSHRA